MFMPDAPLRFSIPSYKRVLRSIDDSGPCNMSRLSRNVDISYAHVVRLLRLMEEGRLIRSERSGRNQVVALTDNGRTILAGLRQELSLLPRELVDDKIQ